MAGIGGNVYIVNGERCVASWWWRIQHRMWRMYIEDSGNKYLVKARKRRRLMSKPAKYQSSSTERKSANQYQWKEGRGHV